MTWWSWVAGSPVWSRPAASPPPAATSCCSRARPQVGGKLRRGEVAGLTVDVGAEAMLARRPEGVGARRGARRRGGPPDAATSAVWSRGSLRTHAALADGRALRPRPARRQRRAQPRGPDPRERRGRHPRRRRRLGRRPGRGAARRRGRRPARRAAARRRVRRPRPPHLGAPRPCRSCSPWPARGSLLEQAAGVPRLGRPGLRRRSPAGWAGCPRLVADGGGFEVRTSATVRALRRTPSGWALTVGPTTQRRDDRGRRGRARHPRRRRPPGCSATSLPDAAAELAAVESASVAVVTLAFRAQDVPDALFDRSGLPRAAGRAARRSRPRPSPSPSGTGCARLDPDARGAAHLARTAPRGGRPSRPATRGWCGSSLADLADAGRASPPARRHPRAAVGRRAAAVRRRPPRPGRPDPRGRRRTARARGLRGGVRRRRHPRGASARPGGPWPRSTRAE